MTNYSLLLGIAFYFILIFVLVETAPVFCSDCDDNCNGTDYNLDGPHEFDNLTHVKRNKLYIMQRICATFRPEIILIPISIAMIPLGLTALLFCACFCGPKDSRGNIPQFIKKTEAAVDESEITDGDLIYENGIVKRKDSSRIRFSTVISFIDMRRLSNNGQGQTDENNKSTRLPHQSNETDQQIQNRIEIEAKKSNDEQILCKDLQALQTSSLCVT